MDESSSKGTLIECSDWVLALDNFEHVIATGNEPLQLKAISKLSHLCNRAPESILISTVPILVELLDTSSTNPTNAVLKAAVYCLKCISSQGEGRLAVTIGQSGAIQRILCLLPQVEVGLQKVLLKCLRNIVAFDGPNRVNVVRIGGLKVIIDMLNSCPDSLRLLLLDILSALSLLREVRRSIYNLRAVHLLVESGKVGKLCSRTRAAQAIGLLGLVKKARRDLVNSGAIQVLADLLRTGDMSTKIVAGNALGVISSHVDYIRPVAEHGVIPLYTELLQVHDPLCKEIAEDVFCILAVTDTNANTIVEHMVMIMRGNDNESIAAAADVLWDLSSYKHVLPVIHSSGAISLLFELLRTSEDTNVKENVCGAIAQLSDNEAERVVIASLDGISLLISMLEDESDDVRDFAAQALVYFHEDPLLCNRVSGALDHPSFLSMQERLVHERGMELRLAASVRQMTVDELTWNPGLV
ncbi:Armadillo [Artemisia annua]|uniref:Armadillo n=1 Tax=Artemisia annua TaxID=35608 RepID=A0A2U1M0P5_ARTAN|nr:Armadillo [Artemisia annua]